MRRVRPLVDVFTLALLYSLRLFGGGEASRYRLSPWLLAFSIFLFLGLATIKRVGELMDVRRHGGLTTRHRGYHTDDVAILQTMGVAASFVSATVLALFVQSDSVAARYSHPQFLWLIVPLLLFWQCRLWLSTARGHMHDDPIVYAARDHGSWWTAAAILVVLHFGARLQLPARVGAGVGARIGLAVCEEKGPWRNDTNVSRKRRAFSSSGPSGRPRDSCGSVRFCDSSCGQTVIVKDRPSLQASSGRDRSGRGRPPDEDQRAQAAHVGSAYMFGGGDLYVANIVALLGPASRLHVERRL